MQNTKRGPCVLVDFLLIWQKIAFPFAAWTNRSPLPSILPAKTFADQPERRPTVCPKLASMCSENFVLYTVFVLISALVASAGVTTWFCFRLFKQIVFICSFSCLIQYNLLHAATWIYRCKKAHVSHWPLFCSCCVLFLYFYFDCGKLSASRITHFQSVTIRAHCSARIFFWSVVFCNNI